MGLWSKNRRHVFHRPVSAIPPPIPVELVSVTFISTSVARWLFDQAVSPVTPGGAEPMLLIDTVASGLIGAESIMQGPAAESIDATYSSSLTVGRSASIPGQPANLNPVSGFAVPVFDLLAGPSALVLTVAWIDATHARWTFNQDPVVTTPGAGSSNLEVRSSPGPFVTSGQLIRTAELQLTNRYSSVQVPPGGWRNLAQPSNLTNLIAFPQSGSVI